MTIVSDYAYFAVSDGVSQREFVIKIIGTAKINSARNQINGSTPNLHIRGLVSPIPADYNPNYNYHLEPNSIEFFSNTSENCNYHFFYVERNLDEIPETLLSNYRLCPYTSTLVRELSESDVFQNLAQSKFYILTDGVSDKTLIAKINRANIQSRISNIELGLEPDLPISGDVIPKRLIYNLDWNFHLDPDSIDFFTTPNSNCNWTFDTVESNIANIGNTFLANIKLCSAKSSVILETEVPVVDYQRPTRYWQANTIAQSIVINGQSIVKFSDWPTTYALAAGTLPGGLTLTNTGVMTGTVNVANISLSDILVDFNFETYVNNNLSFPKVYNISVVNGSPYFNGDVDQSRIADLDYELRYQFVTERQINNPGSFWRLAQGTLPPGASISSEGLVCIPVDSTVLPFERTQFIMHGSPGIDSLQPAYWLEWLEEFMMDVHDYDYQFMIELVDINGIAMAGHTVRISVFEQPLWARYFQVNYNFVHKLPQQKYYYMSTSEDELIIWDTPSGLIGNIANGGISTLEVHARAFNGERVFIDFKPGAANKFPQGLKLQDNGLISGRVSFKCRADDASLPVDDVYFFTLRAYSYRFDSYSDRQFSIKIDRINNKPYENIWINAYPYIYQRELFQNLMADQNIFPDELIYRPTDPWFGKANRIRILFAPGLNIFSPADYENLLVSNHYDKKLYFGEVKTAVNLRNDLSIEYEVVYLTIIDPTMGLDPISNLYTKPIVRELDLRPFITNYYIEDNTAYYTIKPNSLDAMQHVIQKGVGLLNNGIVPSWMTSVQPIIGRPGHFSPAMGFQHVAVLCYCKPGGSVSIANAVKNFNFNQIQFEFDRYQLESRLSEFYDTQANAFMAGNLITIDSGTTVFDSNTTLIMENVDNYADPETGDKYLKFPKVNIFK